MRVWRWLLAVVVASGTALAVPSSAPAPAAAAGDTRPNIIVITMDDMRWDELRYAPNVRRYITARGLRFANAFAPLPLCCPSRASFLLGKYAHNHGVMHHEPPYGFGSLNDSRTVAGTLRAAGYNTGFVGKYLNGYGRQRSKVTGRSSMLYKPNGWTDWMASLETRWPRGSRYSGGTYNYMSFTQNINGRVRMNKGKYSSNVVAVEAANLVSKYHRSSKPFFLWVNPVAPHHGGPREARDPRNYRKANGYVQQFQTPYTPRWVRGRFDRVITHAPGVPLRHRAEADITDKPYTFRRYLENTSTERGRLRSVARQRAEAIYAWDVAFRSLVARLRATGEYGRTVLVFTSDNGYYLGEHRHPAGKIEPHEPSVRVPLVIAGPRVQRGTRYTPAMTHDLTATVIDLARARPLPGMDGISLRPVLTGPDRPWSRPVLLEALFSGPRHTNPAFPARLSEFGVRTGRYKYVRYSGGFEELYDLVRDPNELTGRQRDPAYAEVKAQMRALWSSYLVCRTGACNAPIPEHLQMGVPALRSQEVRARQLWNSYYN